MWMWPVVGTGRLRFACATWTRLGKWPGVSTDIGRFSRKSVGTLQIEAQMSMNSGAIFFRTNNGVQNRRP
jgi:hypothetical protein